MNTTYLVYISSDTDVGLLCWLTEKQNIHVSFPFIQCRLGGGWGTCTPDQKNSYYGNISQESFMTTIYIARVFINVLEAVSHKRFPFII